MFDVPEPDQAVARPDAEESISLRERRLNAAFSALGGMGTLLNTTQDCRKPCFANPLVVILRYSHGNTYGGIWRELFTKGKLKSTSALCVLCIALAPMSAAADTIVQNRNVALSSVTASDLVNDFDAFMAAGTLNAVSLSWNLSASFDVSTLLCSDYLDCEPSDVFLGLFGSDPFAGLDEEDSDNAGFTNATNASQFSSVSAALVGTQGFATAGFLRAGPIGVLEFYTDNDGFMNTQGGSATGPLTLTYDYTPTSAIPLPATGILLFAGLAGLGAAARRRRG